MPERGTRGDWARDCHPCRCSDRDSDGFAVGENNSKNGTSAGGAVGAVVAGTALQAGVPESQHYAGVICRRGIMVREGRDCVPRGAMVHQAPFTARPSFSQKCSTGVN